ncbi:MAG: hypothetical protein GXP19_03205 [Gammaproteobacteria bacterium]|nr:hypothetical protein [Gammaproteobacteria bacterium]
MSEEIALQWLHDAAATANAKDHQAHMELISQKVNLLGVPGFESIGYEQWSTQCKHEFENNLLKNVRYDGLKLIVSKDVRIMFKTHETVEGSNGEINAQGIEVLLEKESDNKWRLVQERILPPEESVHDQLLH